MYFVKIQDEYFFTNSGLQEIKSKYKLDKLEPIFADTTETIDKCFKNGSINEKFFYAPYLPEQIDLKYKNIFDVIRAENKYGLLTKKQYEDNISAFQVLEEKLGAKIHHTNLTFANYIVDQNSTNFKSILENISLMKSRDEFGLKTKGYFLTGLPGTGKTFFAKCVAGELKRVLIELNLSFFMNIDDTFGALETFFNFFKNNEGAYVILIDEIEKMFNETAKSKQVLGYLLTVLNEFGNTKQKSDVLFIATANNVTDLVRKNPELFRRGRFDMNIFLSAPTEEKAVDIFNNYIAIYQKLFRKTSFKLCCYLAVSDPNNSYKLYKTSRIYKIIEKIRTSEFYDIFLQIYNDSKATNQDIFYAALTETAIENDELNSYIKNIISENDFIMNAQTYVDYTFSIYRSQLKTDRNEFPYVPAEIENIVKEVYNEFYFSKNENFSIEEYLRFNIPLQISMSEGVLEMIGSTKNFAKI
ncbi:ATP-binding protein [Campylobacter canadensis]|uniref:ATP-binding protein n=1 Tax=Campylobacter canadensis TaxID=449520 RepID=UPI001CCB9AFD|nr:ATP-binding protein [Campylobacter canadensis]MBZ8002693.1 AAA family ATPase [Campylobacter canadensis]